ncbi:MAG: patatin-like phospholipase family protein [Clostridia bacterium]|nr:patatin-like phospholipase family protein [Clostridia bacterium]
MRWALALGGGALKGAAHIGVLSVLEEAGLEPDIYTGTSVGSLVAAMAAGGARSADMARHAAELSTEILFDARQNALSLAYIGTRTMFEALGVQSRLLKPTPNGIAPGLRLEEWIRERLPERDPDRLSRAAIAVAADLQSGAQVLLGSARVLPVSPPPAVVSLPVRDMAAAVRASASIPWLYAPKRIGGRMLVDGAVVSPVPVHAARLAGADVVVAVDLGHDNDQPQEVRGIARVLNRTLDVATRRLCDLQLRLYADLVIRPEIGRVDLTDFHRIPDLIEIGRAAAKRSLPELMALLDVRASAAEAGAGG